MTTFARECGVDGRLVRIFNTYGPRMNPRDGRVVPNFISQALSGRPLTIYGDGQQTRAFCYVTDMVAGLRAVMDAPREVASGRVYNVGNPDERVILDFAHIIRDLVGSDSAISFVDLPEDDPRVRRPDTTLARELLGWSPRVPMVDGLTRTLAWFETQVAREPVGQPVA